MKVLVTGANGFVGKNLVVKLKEKSIDYATLSHTAGTAEINTKVKDCDFLVHLAGVNRPENDAEFAAGNRGFTEKLCEAITATGAKAKVIYSSSIHADRDSAYGISKREAEQALEQLSQTNGNQVLNIRLPNLFGKWCRPNYNSVVATFCYNVANDLPISVADENIELTLCYIDDVVDHIVQLLESNPDFSTGSFNAVSPQYHVTLGKLVELLYAFKNSRENITSEKVGVGFTRALYSTYISYFEPEQFSYSLTEHRDERGVFVEMLRTQDSGQFSFFTAKPGITRGGHYHHTKNEKFLVLKGTARFGFRHIITGETYVLETSDRHYQVVETVPGWSHDITNIGDEELVVMLWANELFDPENPDTIAHKV